MINVSIKDKSRIFDVPIIHYWILSHIPMLCSIFFKCSKMFCFCSNDFWSFFNWCWCNPIVHWGNWGNAIIYWSYRCNTVKSWSYWQTWISYSETKSISNILDSLKFTFWVNILIASSNPNVSISRFMFGTVMINITISKVSKFILSMMLLS